MRRTLLFSPSLIALGLMLGPGAALAQDGQQQVQNQQQAQNQQQGQEVAQQCLSDLESFGQEMADEGYWLTGWGRPGWRPHWGAPGAGGFPEDGAEAMPEDGPQTAPPADVAPWRGVAAFDVGSPRYQIRTLYAATHVLARQGEEEVCRANLEQLRETAETYITNLREAGVESDAPVTWRRERLASAVPMDEIADRGAVSLDTIIGSDVRNVDDEYLGSVADVVFDPQEESIAYAIIAYGGFLGMGDDYVAVPWENLEFSPGLNVVVLQASEDEMQRAPDIDPNAISDAEALAEHSEEIDSYWQEQRG